MRCYLAAFDQAHLSEDRTYWTWHHPDLSMQVLDSFLYECATKHWPGEAAPVAANRVRGGFGAWIALGPAGTGYLTADRIKSDAPVEWSFWPHLCAHRSPPSRLVRRTGIFPIQ